MFVGTQLPLTRRRRVGDQLCRCLQPILNAVVRCDAPSELASVTLDFVRSFSLVCRPLTRYPTLC